MSGISGFPSNKKVNLGTSLTNNFATVIPTDPHRNALEVNRYAFRVDDPLNARTAGAGTGLETVDGQSLFWVEDTATPARAGDFARFEDGNAAFLELPIIKVETNRFLISVNSGVLPAASDTFFILRYTTQRVDETGSQIVVASPGPTQFVLDGLDVEVEMDTVTPSNSKPLPIIQLDPSGVPYDPANPKQIAFMKNGSEVVVTEDTVTPSNNIPLPVKLTSVTGDINITAGDLNVQLSDQGANPDVTRIGDGTNQLAMTASGEATTSDADTHTKIDAANVLLTSLDGKDFATQTTLAAAALSLASIEAEDFATQTTLAAAAVSLANIEAEDFATETTLAALAAEDFATETTLSALETKAATETTLDAINTKTPALGQAAKDASVPVTIASDQEAMPTKAPVNAAGNSPGTTTVSTVATITAPANAVGFILMNLDSSSANIRYRIGATATSSSGQQLQPGRDTGYVPCAANISICAESGTQDYDIQWILSA